MPVSRQKKEVALQELVDKFGRSKSVVFAGYRGLTVSAISQLRAELRKEQAELKVGKKTLMNIAAKDIVGSDLDKSIMEGPVFATFSYEDPLAGIRVLFKFSKMNENVKLLGGIVDGKMVGPEVIKKYAHLPSRPELLAKLLGSMIAPLSGFMGIGKNLIAGMVRVLDAYKDTLPTEQQASAAAPAASTEPAASAATTEVAEAPAATEEVREEGSAPEAA